MWRVFDSGHELPPEMSVWEDDHLVELRCGRCPGKAVVVWTVAVSRAVLYEAAYRHHETFHEVEHD